MRPCLVEAKYGTINPLEPTVFSWYAPIHDEVKAQGGEWEWVATYWVTPKRSNDPRSISVTGKPFNAVVLINVPDYSLITQGYVLPLIVDDKADFMQFIINNSASIIPNPFKNKLKNDGFDITGTIYQMLEGILV